MCNCSKTGSESLLPGATRRTALGVAGGGALVGVVAACGGDQDTGGGAAGGDGGDGGENGGGDSGETGTPIGTVDEVPVGEGAIFGDHEVVVTQPAEGDFRAFSTSCTHSGCPVDDVAGGEIHCPCHGSRFSIEDGSPTGGPADSPLEEVQISVDGDDIVLA